MRIGEDSPHHSSLCVARQRLGVAPVRHLFQTTLRPLAQPNTPGAFYQGLRLNGIDGVVYNTPDTEANDKAFGRPSGGDRGMGAFSQVRKVSLVEVGTHVELAFVLKGLVCGKTTAMEGFGDMFLSVLCYRKMAVFSAISNGNVLFLKTSWYLRG